MESGGLMEGKNKRQEKGLEQQTGEKYQDARQ
jgi:hypothetical protein